MTGSMETYHPERTGRVSARFGKGSHGHWWPMIHGVSPRTLTMYRVTRALQGGGGTVVVVVVVVVVALGALPPETGQSSSSSPSGQSIRPSQSCTSQIRMPTLRQGMLVSPRQSGEPLSESPGPSGTAGGRSGCSSGPEPTAGATVSVDLGKRTMDLVNRFNGRSTDGSHTVFVSDLYTSRRRWLLL